MKTILIIIGFLLSLYPYTEVFAVSPWCGTRVLKGINAWIPYGDHRRSFDQEFPKERLLVIKNIGFDFIRLGVFPDAMLPALTDAALYKSINPVMVGVDAITASGIKVIINVAPLSPSGWSASDVIDGVNGTKFQRLLYVEKRFAAIVESINKPDKIAFSLFNEFPFESSFPNGVDGYGLIKELFAGVRSVAPTTMIVVSALDWASGSSLIDDFHSTDFDDNTIYDWHAYYPMAAARQT